MWQLLMLLLFPKVIFVDGLVKRFGGDYDNILGLGEYSGRPRISRVNSAQPDPLWVLRLFNDGTEDLKLKVASRLEERDFYYAIVPLIKSLEEEATLPRQTRKKESAVLAISENDKPPNRKILKKEIMKIVNKFALSTNVEPDSYLSESEDKEVCSLALYFKGPYTSFVVKLGRKQWHYFITPSPFPEWFYEEHPDVTIDGKETYINVPDILHTEFYKVLLDNVHVFLGFPI